ncbi:hypothetical protein N7983_06550 [Priestia megaterium]|uniref:hypothetical protein n=1 Tax=Priestia megaterium TaxID=1404 RepID=UPI001292FECE|nr:hypothetical protein [Priestia megaterium]MCU7737393.1 hypothetical protein [Priestia megaterium]MCU7742823.1 hypothetical protein [Priestia megaterium]MEB2291595.1 hypothetical protein [Priestia megaterium]MEE3894122.1 hypothetical protein [Priestia megaterium]WRQ91475.1 hypothetical protein NQ126_019000 [Priestia megaterium]
MIENLTRSDFFIGRVNVGFVYVDEEAHQRKTKSYTEINSDATSSGDHLSHLSVFRLD